MRELKFRGMLRSGEWVYGGYVKTTQGVNCILSGECDHCEFDGKTKNILSFNAVKFKTVGQYTGLHDKNSVEIYEGDIVKLDILGTALKYNPLEALLHVIEWNNACWGWRSLYPELVVEEDREWVSFWKDEDKELWNSEYFEVIGNIHENKELLK